MHSLMPKPRLWPRISLLNLLLMTSVIALSLSIWGETSRRLPLEREIDALRHEVGTVTVRDPTQMYIQPLAKSVDALMHYRWRAYVPPNLAGEVTVEVQQQNEMRVSFVTMTLDSGESGFEFVTLRSVSGTLWNYQLGNTASERRGSTSGPKPPWLVKGGKSIGLAFKDFKTKPGISEGQEATLMDLIGKSDDGEAVRVVVSARLYASGKSPSDDCRVGHRPLLLPFEWKLTPPPPAKQQGPLAPK